MSPLRDTKVRDGPPPYGDPDPNDSPTVNLADGIRELTGLIAALSASVPAARAADRPIPAQLDPNERDWCYLALARQDSWRRFAQLGPNPWAATAFSWLQENIGVWSGGKFAFTYGSMPGSSDGRAFVQAHVVPDTYGISVSEILKLPAGGVRLGADPQRPMAGAETHAGSPGLSLAIPAADPVVRIPFSVRLKSVAGRTCLSPRTSSVLGSLTKYFESVQLVGFKMSATIAGGTGTSLLFGIGTGSIPTTEDGFLALPVCVVYSGDANTAGAAEYILPDDHGFGRELKGVAVGNPDPVFYWMVPSEPPGVAIIRGVISVRLSGHGVAPPFLLSPTK